MSEENTPIEIDLRGAALKVSVTIEQLLMVIVYMSNAEQYSEKNSKNLKIKNSTFGEKLVRVRNLLGRYHKDLLLKYCVLFEELNTFKEFRNKMAHCVFEWNYSTATFNIMDVVEDESEFQFLKAFPFSVMEAKIATLKGLRLTEPLKNLSKEVSFRLKANHPELYDILN